MRAIDHLRMLAQQETLVERRQRMIPGAIYGLTMALMYFLVGSIVNQLSFPDLPAGVDWRNLLLTSMFFAVWLGLGGAFINWFTQTEESLVISVFVMSLTALIAGALTFEGTLPTQFGRLVLLAMPVLVVSLLMTLILRWLGVHHADALETQGRARRLRITLLFALALLLGGVTGFSLTRWTTAVQRGVRHIHENLQLTTSDPAQAETRFLLRDVPAAKDHLQSPYTLRGKPSAQSVVGIEVNVDFADGFRMACMLLVFPDQPPFPLACAEGEQAPIPPQ